MMVLMNIKVVQYLIKKINLYENKVSVDENYKYDSSSNSKYKTESYTEYYWV